MNDNFWNVLIFSDKMKCLVKPLLHGEVFMLARGESSAPSAIADSIISNTAMHCS